jgi:GNAT superfamily N-acetyltransferase
LSTDADHSTGCVALRPLDDLVCEMKRLFVRPNHQGHGLGRALAKRVIGEARSIGYATTMLDTLPSMQSAIRLYASLGFVRRSASYDKPWPETAFLELTL